MRETSSSRQYSCMSVQQPSHASMRGRVMEPVKLKHPTRLTNSATGMDADLRHGAAGCRHTSANANPRAHRLRGQPVVVVLAGYRWRQAGGDQSQVNKSDPGSIERGTIVS